MPVALSLNTIASDRKPTPGRDGPARTSEPLKVDTAACLAPPSGMVVRLPAAVQVPSNSRHSPPEAAAVETWGAPPHAVITTRAINPTSRRDLESVLAV